MSAVLGVFSQLNIRLAEYSISSSFCTLSLCADRFRYFNINSVSIKTSNCFLSSKFTCAVLFSLDLNRFFSSIECFAEIVNLLCLLLYRFKRVFSFFRLIFLFIPSYFDANVAIYKYKAILWALYVFYCCPSGDCFLLLLIREGMYA